MFTYNRESGYYWFNTELAADRENEYSLVGLVSSPTTFTNSYITLYIIVNFVIKNAFLTYSTANGAGRVQQHNTGHSLSSLLLQETVEFNYRRTQERA